MLPYINSIEQHDGSSVKRALFILSSTDPILNHYSIQNYSIGQGTYGKVVKATHLLTNQERAIKIIKKKHIKDIERFQREIEILKSMDHPNIARLHETFEDEKYIFLVLELCSGGELFKHIERCHRLSELESAVLFKQILSVIIYLHRFGVVHRDLKPENFLFFQIPDSPFEAESNHAAALLSSLKLIDFGLAEYIPLDITPEEQNKFLHTKAGTPYYVAPEVLRGSHGFACDLWSAGIILYILLSGYPPFRGSDDVSVLRRVMRGTVSFPESEWGQISGSAKDLICKLLTVDPSRRISAIDAWNHEWLQSEQVKSFETQATSGFNVEGLQERLAEKFESFANYPLIKKMAITIMAQQMTEEEVDGLRPLFQSLDTSGCGVLNIEDIKECIRKAKDYTPAEIEDIFHKVDTDKSGFIDYTELIGAMMDRKVYEDEQRCRSAFKVLDRDGDGELSNEELSKALKRTCKHHDLGPIFDELTPEMEASNVKTNDELAINYSQFLKIIRDE